MTFKHIMVHLDSTAHTAKRVDIALALAKGASAHVTAVFGETTSDAPADTGLDTKVSVTSENADKVLAAFAEKADAAGISHDSRQIPAINYGQLTKHLSYAARDCDMAVFGQHDSATSKGECPEDLVEQVIIHCGRPVLVIPYAGDFPNIGKRVLIGWNGTGESARAMNFALPLMQDSADVKMVSINPPKEILEHHDAYNESVLKHLKVHGVTARVDQEPNPDVSVANLLVSRAYDHGADLLVMGAHSHTGLTTRFRGSVTRDLLGQLTVPALLSH